MRNLSPDDLRKSLAIEAFVEENAFMLLRAISYYVNNPDTEDLGREFVLRALEKRQCFGNLQEVLDSLTRQVGLFPYLEPNNLSFRDLLALELHRPPSMDETFVFHRAQAEVYRRLMEGENVVLSAPTSFGKSKIIDAIIAAGTHNNIALIVPTIALIDETRIRVSSFSDTYKIISQLSQKPESKNIFVFTAERINGYEYLPKIDFFVIDEFYKIGALKDDEPRTVSLNQAFYKLFKGGGQFYMLGPNIREIPEGLQAKFRCFFYSTNFATVVSEVIRVNKGKDDLERLIYLAKDIEDQTLIFCKSPNRVNEVAKALIENKVCEHVGELDEAFNWMADKFHEDWIFPKALSYGVGMHHGRLPRSLSQFAVRCFNKGQLKFLVCTSTLIEGVNTKAKNIIIFDDTINKKKYDFFTFNNIRGRSGRMFQHFVGKVYLFNEPPQEELPFVDFPLFTQGSNTPESLLIQLDDVDLKQSSKNRLGEVMNQMILPLDIIRKNSTIDPKKQVELAELLATMPKTDTQLLLWKGFPNWKQLSFTCDVIWKYLHSGSPKSGVFSSKQLAYKSFALMRNQDIKSRIATELEPGKYAAKTIDEAVERIFEFDRNWAGFEFPRLLMALSRIQNYIFDRRLQAVGDYSVFATKLETLFRNPICIALEEFGLPIQLSEKIRKLISLGEDIDGAIQIITNMDVERLKLDSFEKQLLIEIQGHI
jgi:hypothetical protein